MVEEAERYKRGSDGPYITVVDTKTDEIVARFHRISDDYAWTHANDRLTALNEKARKNVK